MLPTWTGELGLDSSNHTNWAVSALRAAKACLVALTEMRWSMRLEGEVESGHQVGFSGRSAMRLIGKADLIANYRTLSRSILGPIMAKVPNVSQ